MPTSFTPNKNYSNQATGENVNLWGIILNANFSLIDNNLGGTLSLDISGSSGGTLSLTTNQAQYIFHNLTGAISGNVNYQFPADGGIYFINNATTGAHTVTISIVGGGASVVVPQGSSSFVGVDASALLVKTISALNPANNLSDVLSTSTSLSNLGGAPLASPVFTGTPSLPTGTSAVTQSAGDNSTKIATTAFVNGTALTLANNTTATTQTPGNSSTKVATTAFVATQPTINQPNIVGTTTNDSAAAGSVGQYVESVVAVGSAVALTNGTPLTITSISLTAGDWDVGIQGYFTGGASTVFFNGQTSISSTNNTIDASIGKYSYIFGQSTGTPFTSLTSQVNCNIIPYRILLASTTTIYFVAQASFTTSTCGAYGLIRARRIR